MANNNNNGAQRMAAKSLELTHEEMLPVLARSIRAGVVPFIQSSPGMGKSAMIHQVADMANLKLIDHRLSTSQPEDLSGLPDVSGDKSIFKPFDIFPIEGDPLPNGKNGWLLFLDEFNSASKETQAAAYKLVLDRMTGQHKLHENVHIVAAGNLSSDKAITNKLGSAMVSRVQHLKLRLDAEWFLEKVASAKKWDPRVISFLSYEPTSLMTFNPDEADQPFDCPRTWDMRQRIIKFLPKVDHTNLAELSGLGRSETVSRFITFCKIFEDMPKIDEIVNDPLGARLPSEKDRQFAVVGYLVEQTTKENVDAIYRYVLRMDLSFQIIFFRRVIVRTPELRYAKSIRLAFVDLSEYLNGLPEPRENKG